MAYTGIQAFLEVLAAAGVKHIFGNPGSTELPLNDALVADERFSYILGLQEVPVVAMADGFAMASRSVGVVNVHISCGLGSAMGMLYNAFREGTPLLLTAGQQDRRLIFEEPVLAGDLVSVTRPWTKWSAEVQWADDMPAAVRRAIQTALAPPTGPVFLALPVDVQTELCGATDFSPPSVLPRGMRPALPALEQAGALLLSAKRPAIVAGSRVTESGAVAALANLAETIGTPVYCESNTSHGRLPFPSGHPLNAYGLPLWSPEVRDVLAPYDVLLAVGIDLLRQYIYHEPARPIPEHARLIQLDEDPWQIGKNYPLEVGLQGDIRASLDELAELVGERMTETEREAARSRSQEQAEKSRQQRQALKEQIEDRRHQRPLAPSVFMEAIARALPPDVAVVEEAVTTTGNVLERLGAIKDPGGYFGHRGWALGWGLGCTLGVKLAWPDRPALGILGEGSAMYGIQGLWSAAHHRIPATFVIANNAQYQILKVCADQYGLPAAAQKQYQAMDLTDPEVDIVALAQSLGVRAFRVREPDELTDLLRESLTAGEPRLIDVPISRERD